MFSLASSFPIANCRLPIGLIAKLSNPSMTNRQLKIGNRQCSLQSHRHARILSIHLRVATQQFLCFFLNYFRENYLHFDELVAMNVWIAQRWSSATAQAKLLSRLSAWRNSELSFA